MPPQTLIIGCGYIGLPLALQLQEAGNEITAWFHSPASAATLAEFQFKKIIIGSVGDAGTWEQADIKFDRVIHCASSGRGGEAAYEEVFQRGILLIGERQPEARRLFVSSTSVYGQTKGEVVTERSRAEPVAPTSRILRGAERAALLTGTIVVRSSGIYGPDRGVLFEKYRRGEAVIEGDGLRWINQIHQRDLVSALAHLVEKGAPGEVYNASDDAPVTYYDYYAWCSDFLQRPMPPFLEVNDQPAQKKRGLTSKRVSNAKLRATGWTPFYPSFREGVPADHSPK
jgi:nucleoside-diphosphate-sugar epimerase